MSVGVSWKYVFNIRNIVEIFGYLFLFRRNRVKVEIWSGLLVEIDLGVKLFFAYACVYFWVYSYFVVIGE